MKVSVIIATYQRKNGNSVLYLKNMFKILEAQTYKDFKVFIVGDSYENNTEFENLCKSYNGDIYYSNSDVHFRNCFNIKKNMWSSGGINARLIGIEKAISENYDYYFHLDDDDYWEPNHIENYINTINKYNGKLDFIVSKSEFFNIVLPRAYVHNENINNFIIKPCDIVHASWCINLKTIGNDFINWYKERINIINNFINKKYKEYYLEPFDSIILGKLNKLQKEKKINVICLKTITCKKKTEGEILE